MVIILIQYMVYWTIDKTALAMYIYVFKHYILHMLKLLA